MGKRVWMQWAAAAAGLALMVSASPALAQGKQAVAGGDWPKYLGPDNTGISAEPIADKWPADGPAKVWSAKVGKSYASPVAQDGKIYFFSEDNGQEVLTAFDADTGKVLWREAYKGGYPRDDYPGVRATPTIDGGTIYTFGGGGMLAARDVKTGKGLWNFDVLKATGGGLLTWGQASSPLVHDNLVIVQGGAGGSIAVAVDKKTGKGVWKSEAQGTSGYAQVIAINVDGKPQLVVFGGTAVVGMDPATGKTLWKQDWKTSYDVNAATPVYDGQGNLFVASGYQTGGGMLKVTPTGVSKAWGPDKKFLCKFQPPIKDGNTVYLVGEDKRGTIKAMSWPDGAVKWDLKDAKVGFGGSLLRVGGHLIAQSQNGDIHLIKASPESGELVSSFKPFDGSDKVWSMPIVYRGKLFAKGDTELVAFDVKK